MSKPLEQRIYDGARAKEVLDNEAFAQAFADIEQEYTDAWKQSPARDAEGREKLYTMLRLMHKLKTTLEASLTDGKLAQADLAHLQEKQSLLDRAKAAVGLN